jgi:hypothetical protein
MVVVADGVVDAERQSVEETVLVGLSELLLVVQGELDCEVLSVSVGVLAGVMLSDVVSEKDGDVEKDGVADAQSVCDGVTAAE